MRADALGRPRRFIATAGQAGGALQAAALLDGQPGQAALAGKACDSAALHATIAAMKAAAVIPSNRRRKIVFPTTSKPASIAAGSSEASQSSSASAALPPATIAG